MYSKMPPVYLCCYASGPWIPAVPRVLREAHAMNVFTDIFIYGYTDLDVSFRHQHEVWMSSQRRGHGYWIWKPQVILQTLRRIPENAIVLYMDIGCSLIPSGIKRFNEYVELVTAHPSGVLAFSLESIHPEARWNKGDLLRLFDVDGDSLQVLSGIEFMVNTPTVRRMVEQWLTYMSNYHLIDDSPSILPNDPRFTEHRHDQSVWSLLVKTNKCLVIPDETYWYPTWDAPNYPIHSKRQRV